MEFNRGTRLTLRAVSRSLVEVAKLTEIVRAISRPIAEVGLGDKTPSWKRSRCSVRATADWFDLNVEMDTPLDEAHAFTVRTNDCGQVWRRVGYAALAQVPGVQSSQGSRSASTTRRSISWAMVIALIPLLD